VGSKWIELSTNMWHDRFSVDFLYFNRIGGWGSTQKAKYLALAAPKNFYIYDKFK
jgi:hypothetical protein